MQNLAGFTPLPKHIIARRRRILVGQADLALAPDADTLLTAGGGDMSTPQGSATATATAENRHAKKNHVPTVEEVKALQKATIFAKDGYVTRPLEGAAKVAVWVPRGWRCEETCPAWGSSVLYFRPAKEAIAEIDNGTSSKAPAKKGKGSKGKCTTVTDSAASPMISAAAASDPVACLRLTIQDLHSEVGEQTAAEYCADIVSNIYREQTRFEAAKYKVSGPKITLDQPLGEGQHASYDTATTSTDDEDFNRFQRMLTQRGGPVGGSSSSSSAQQQVPKHVPRIGGFTNILSYQTSTIINRHTSEPRRVQVHSTSVVCVKGRFVYAFELQSSPANHTLPPATSAASAANNAPSMASTSWMQCFVQMAQVMRFDLDDNASDDDKDDGGSDEESNSPRRHHGGGSYRGGDSKITGGALNVPKASHLIDGYNTMPHCAMTAWMRLLGGNRVGDGKVEGEEYALPLFSVRSPALWTPSLANPAGLLEYRPRGCDGTMAGVPAATIVPLITFETNSEAFPARIEVYYANTAEGSDAKTALTDTIAAMGLQRSYTVPTVTVEAPTLVASGKEANPPLSVTITPCIIAPQQQKVAATSYGYGMPPPSAPTLTARRFTMCPLSSTTAIIAVEVPLRRNLLKTAAADLARTVASMTFGNGEKSADDNSLPTAFIQQLFASRPTQLASSSSSSSSASSNRPKFALSLARRIVSPSMGYSLLVGDGCQCLASSLRPDVVSIAVRPALPYATNGSDDHHADDDNESKLFIIERSAEDSVLPRSCKPAEEDEGLVTITGTYEPRIDFKSDDDDTTAESGAAQGSLKASKRDTRKSASSSSTVAKSTDMTTALMKSVSELAAELAEDEGRMVSAESVVIPEWLTMIGDQKQGKVVSGVRREVQQRTPSEYNLLAKLGLGTAHFTSQTAIVVGCTLGTFAPITAPSSALITIASSNSLSSTTSNGNTSLSATARSGLGASNNNQQQEEEAKEWPSLQAHLRSATDPSNGAFVTMQTVYDVTTNRGAVIKAVSPNFALFRKHRGLLMNRMLPSFEFTSSEW